MTLSATAAPPERMLRVAGQLGVWLFGGALLSTEMYFNARMNRGYADTGDILLTQFGRAAMWALLLPWVFRLARLQPPRRAPAILFHLGFGVALMAVFYLGRILAIDLYWRQPLAGFWRDATANFYGRNLVDCVFYWAAVLGGQGLDAIRRQRAEELRAAQLETKLVEAELKALKHQLDPHFLFNSLNSVAVLVREARNDEAVSLIAKLSTLLRLTMDSSKKPITTLGEELAFIDQYVEIQRVRFGAKLGYEKDIAAGAAPVLVPTLILQPAVENAIVHGIARMDRPGTIRISARLAGPRLEVEVADDGPGCAFAVGSGLREGLGLSNTRVRLDRLYRGDYQLVVSATKGEGVSVRFVLPRVRPRTEEISHA